MKYIINNIRLSLDDSDEDLKSAAAHRLKTNVNNLKSFKIIKESVDARRKPNISLIYSVSVEIDGKAGTSSNPDVRLLEEQEVQPLIQGDQKMKNRPVIVGSGPAGLFAGLVLAQNGYRPLILERGKDVTARSLLVEEYWKSGTLDPETNIQFGEGGAGTFSDGKLTTRINDRRCDKVLQEFFLSGAHEEILYKSKPHIGSDVLKKVIVKMRERIEEAGGEIRFDSRLTSLIINNGRVSGVVINEKEQIPSEVVVLAIGHSARDTFQSLLEQGINFIQKPFSIGVRIEHPQRDVNAAQYGIAAGHPKLGSADYQLFCKTGGRTVYSFCMCPGGVVVASASETGSIVTNGMSEFARDKENANSALVVSVEPEDFGGKHPLAGVEFQRTWERLAFSVAGGNNSAPIQTLEDFVLGRNSGRIGAVKPSYTGKTTVSDINLCLPSFVTDSMKESIAYFDRRLKGFGRKDALMTGVETRTSSPVRIPRGETLEAIGVGGLYPAGEGAGYAGGIVSAAVDGIRVAEQVIRTYRPCGS